MNVAFTNDAEYVGIVKMHSVYGLKFPLFGKHSTRYIGPRGCRRPIAKRSESGLVEGPLERNQPGFIKRLQLERQ